MKGWSCLYRAFSKGRHISKYLIIFQSTIVRGILLSTFLDSALRCGKHLFLRVLPSLRLVPQLCLHIFLGPSHTQHGHDLHCTVLHIARSYGLVTCFFTMSFIVMKRVCH